MRTGRGLVWKRRETWKVFFENKKLFGGKDGNRKPTKNLSAYRVPKMGEHIIKSSMG